MSPETADWNALVGIEVDNQCPEDIETARRVISLAEESHRIRPNDVAHDWSHHERVMLNSVFIVEAEDLWPRVDMGVLFSAGALHDRDRSVFGHGAYKLTEEILIRAGADETYIKKVLGLIDAHSQGEKHLSLEARVLWAADKLEYVSAERARSAIPRLKPYQMALLEPQWRGKINQVITQMKNSGLPVTWNIFRERFAEYRMCIEEEFPEHRGLLENVNLP